jgi:hypothetical protein
MSTIFMVVFRAGLAQQVNDGANDLRRAPDEPMLFFSPLMP